MPESQHILDQLEAIDRAYRARASEDFLLFIRGLMIPSDAPSGSSLFDSVMAPFQLSWFAKIAPSLHDIRKGIKPLRRRFWVERTKGAAKDSDLSMCLAWLIAFPTRPLYLQAGAADRDQAAIVKRRMEDLIHYNPWLEDHIKISQGRVENVHGLARLDILAADVAGSHGETPDVLVVNELSHIRKWEFVENLLDNADKVARGLVIIATNAGFKGTKAEVWRKNAIENKDKWFFSK